MAVGGGVWGVFDGQRIKNDDLKEKGRTLHKNVLKDLKIASFWDRNSKKFQGEGVFRPTSAPPCRRGKKVISKAGGGRYDRNVQYIPLYHEK